MLPFTVPLLALALVNVVVHTGGRHIDLEVYRFGVQAWLAGGDMYGTLPETSDHITLPFIYPPFAAIVLLPLAVAPWVLAWSALLALSTAALGLTFYVVARRLWPSGGRGGALSVASIALPLALAVQPGKAIDFSQPAPPIPAFALEPVMQTIEFGQVNLLLMALVAVDVLVARPRWPRGPAHRDRGGHQAHPGRVRPLLPAAPGRTAPPLSPRRPGRWSPASRSWSRRARPGSSGSTTPQAG